MDRIAEQIELVNTQVSKKSKFWIHTNLRPTLSFTCSFKFTYFTIKRILLKEIKKPFKTTTKHKSLPLIYITGSL